MGKNIVIAPVTRLEGHAKINVMLDDSGNVEDTRVQIVELRGFEKFCIGRPVEELPRITTSICGVCPWSHHLASAKACDAVFGADIPPAGRKLREQMIEKGILQVKRFSWEKTAQKTLEIYRAAVQ